MSKPREFASIAELAAAVGETLGPSDWVRIDQNEVNTFAEVTGDWQYIHCDPERARTSMFGGTIVHGYFTVALLSRFAYALYTVRSVDTIINYGLNRVRFPAPMRVGSQVRATAKILAVEPRGSRWEARIEYSLESDASDRPVLVAETVVLFDGAGPADHAR